MIYPENYFFFFPPKNDITWFVIICKLFFVNNAYKLILFAKTVLSFKLAKVFVRLSFIKKLKSWEMQHIEIVTNDRGFFEIFEIILSF